MLGISNLRKSRPFFFSRLTLFNFILTQDITLSVYLADSVLVLLYPDYQLTSIPLLDTCIINPFQGNTLTTFVFQHHFTKPSTDD